MSGMTSWNAVTSLGRAATSARLRTLAPMQAAFLAELCLPVSRDGLHASSYRPGSAAASGIGIGTSRLDVTAAHRSGTPEQTSQHRNVRQFDKHDPGSPVPRPPV